MKWYKNVFLNLLDMALMYSYVMYKQIGGAALGRRNSLTDFKLALVKTIIEKTDSLSYEAHGRRVEQAGPQRLRGDDFPEYIFHHDANVKMYGRCVVCSARSCKVPLCAVPSFRRYHKDQTF